MWALIPINDFSKSMSRLSTILKKEQRVTLTKKLAADTLEILNKIQSIDEIVVMTNESEWVQSLSLENMTILEDFPDESFKAKITKAVDWISKKNINQVIYLSIDLPLIEQKDIESMIAQHENGISIVRAEKDGGTNALIMNLPRKIELQFGINSFIKHIESAKNAQIKVKIMDNKALSIDLDDADDFRKLQNALKE